MQLKYILALSLILVACGGRPPNPVLTSQPDDAKLTCAQIGAEKVSLEHRAYELSIEEYERDQKNIIIASVGWILLFIPYLLLENSETIDIENAALYLRSQELTKIAERLGCPAE